MDMQEGSSRGTSSSQVIFVYSPEQLLRMNSRSPEWTKISNHEKEKLGLTFEDDGEFWYILNVHEVTRVQFYVGLTRNYMYI